MDDVVQWIDYTLIPSTFFTLLHGLQNAYTVQRSSSSSTTRFKKALGTLVMACGGGILTSLILAHPQNVLFSPVIVPVYCGLSLLLTLAPLDAVVDAVPVTVRDVWFNMVDAASRGYALARFLGVLRGMESSCSLVGQVILGIIAITGGGLLYG